MSKKSWLIFGGVAVASTAILAPGGIYLDRKIKRDQFMKKVDYFTDKWNNNSKNSASFKLLKDSEENQNKWKLIWAWDFLNFWRRNNKPQKNINEVQEWYWDQIKKDKKIRSLKINQQYIEEADKKEKEYWRKFKEMCLILISKGEINTVNESSEETWTCFWARGEQGHHEKYLKQNPKGEIMENVWKLHKSDN